MAAACLRAELFIECLVLAVGSEPIESATGAYSYLYRYTSGYGKDKGTERNLGIHRLGYTSNQLSHYACMWHNRYWLCLAWRTDRGSYLCACPQTFGIAGTVFLLRASPGLSLTVLIQIDG